MIEFDVVDDDDDDDGDDDGSKYVRFMMWEEVEEAGKIPASISRVVRRLRQLGFAETGRSECSALAKEHLNAKKNNYM